MTVDAVRLLAAEGETLGRDLPLPPWAIGLSVFGVLCLMLLVTLPSARTAEPAEVPSSMSPAAEPVPPSRLGVMGGTFDPIHHGHLVAASEVAARFALDEVVFVPTGQPWQKRTSSMSRPAEHRYLMTVIATASNPRFTVSRVDIDRQGPTYTIDTLRDLRAQRGPDAELFFITGADALAQILTWKDCRRAVLAGALHRCHPARPRPLRCRAARRPGQPARGARHGDLVARTVAQRVGRGEPVWYLVPDGVVQYVAKHRLYRRRAHPTADPVVPRGVVMSKHRRPESDPLPDVDLAERLAGGPSVARGGDPDARERTPARRPNPTCCRLRRPTRAPRSCPV